MTNDLQSFCAARGWAAPRTLSAAQIKRATELRIVVDPAMRTHADWNAKEDGDLLCAAVDGVPVYDLALRHRRSLTSIRNRLRVLRVRTEPSGAAA